LEPAQFELLEMSALNTFIGLSFGVLIYYGFFIPIYLNVTCLMAVITLWIETDEFSKKSIQIIDSYSVPTHKADEEEIVQTDANETPLFVVSGEMHASKQHKFAHFLKNYTNLETSASNLNSIFGEVFLSVSMSMCFYYAISLSRIFTSVGWANQIIVYYLLIQKAAMLILSGEICRKVCCRCKI